MEGETALHFGTPNSLDPYSGAHSGMESERVLHFGKPDSPDPYCGAHLGMESERVLHFGTPNSPDPYCDAKLMHTKLIIKLAIEFEQRHMFEHPT